MRFLLAPGDRVRVLPVRPDEMVPGDIALLLDARSGKEGRTIVHRVLADSAREGVLTTRGDASWTIEDDKDGLLPAGRVDAVYKRGRWRRIEGSWARRFWRFFPAYSTLVGDATKILYIGTTRVRRMCDRLFGSRGRAICADVLEGIVLLRTLRLLESVPMLLLGGDVEFALAPLTDGASMRLGRIDGDETWSGDVRVIGDVVVGPGASLTLAPGARVRFDQESRYRYPSALDRAGQGVVHPIASQTPRLLVYGRLQAEGTFEAPVVVQEAHIHALASSRVHLGPHVEVSGEGLCAWDGARLDLEGCRISGAQAGVAVRGRAQAILKRTEVFSNEGRALVVEDGARLSAESSSLRSPEEAVSADGGGVLLKSVRLESRRSACARLRCCDAEFSDCEFASSARPALLLEGVELALKDGAGRTARSEAGYGHPLGVGALLIAGKSVSVTARPWRARGDAPVVRSILYRTTLSFILATRDGALFQKIYRAVADAAVKFVAFCAARRRTVSALLVYRSWTERDWRAGISDIDFQGIFSATGKADESAAELKNFFSTYRRWRRWFPALGEILICGQEELQDYVRDGGARAEEFARTARPLYGTVDMLAPRPNPVASVTEALHAYSRMMSIRFSQAADSPERLRCNMRKAFLDVVRYCRRARGSALEGREACEMSARAAQVPWVEALDRGDRDVACTAALGIVDEACGRLLVDRAHPAQTGEANRPATSEVEEAFRRELDSFSRQLRLEGAGYSLEDGERFEVILPESFDDANVPVVFKGFDELRERHSFLRTVPLILSRRSWEFVQQSPYRHHPTAFMDFAAPDESRTTGARGLAGFLRLRRGVPRVERGLNQEHFRDSGIQSLRHLNLCWREMFFSGDPRKAAYHVYTRSLGLRLLLEGDQATPFTEMEGVIAAARERFADTRSWLDRLDLSDIEAGLGDLSRHYAFVSRQLERACEGAQRDGR